MAAAVMAAAAAAVAAVAVFAAAVVAMEMFAVEALTCRRSMSAVAMIATPTNSRRQFWLPPRLL
jgi:hypothetical protein